jgi:ribose transport system ATP-binding protein
MDEVFKLEMRNISKNFSGVHALKNVSLRIRDGEIHALLGENGAGKSTLMKILSGAYQKDAGEIFIDGNKVKITSPKDAKDMGIAVIYQEFMLAPDLTVAENIFIDKFSGGKALINWKKMRKDAQEQLSLLGFEKNISPDAKCGSLTVAYQQVVEICKCLSRNVKILVLDEPTAVLTFNEIQKLFAVLKRLREKGVSIIYISHRLEEIFELSDTITVLKDGAYVETVSTCQINKHRLVNLMVGRELSDLFPYRNATIGDVALRVTDMNAGRMVRNVSFEVRSGEIVGFGGLVGSGRTETMRAIFGVGRKESGTILYFGRDAIFRDPKDAVVKKLGMLPEDRKKQGVLLDQSIRINVTLSALQKITYPIGFIINHKKEKDFVKEVLASISTKYSSIENNVNSLSGGNQQKVALAKWIASDCKCIIFDEPTRGVDVGAKAEIYKVINSFAEQGMAVIMVSSEMAEIIAMCDRAYVMSNGKIVGELKHDELSESNMIKLAMEA